MLPVAAVLAKRAQAAAAGTPAEDPRFPLEEVPVCNLKHARWLLLYRKVGRHQKLPLKPSPPSILLMDPDSMGSLLDRLFCIGKTAEIHSPQIRLCQVKPLKMDLQIPRFYPLVGPESIGTQLLWQMWLVLMKILTLHSGNCGKGKRRNYGHENHFWNNRWDVLSFNTFNSTLFSCQGIKKIHLLSPFRHQITCDLVFFLCT